MGLAFHGLVLSDKVKGTTAVVLWVVCYGGSKEAERDVSEPLKKCREQLQYCQNRGMGGPEGQGLTGVTLVLVERQSA